MAVPDPAVDLEALERAAPDEYRALVDTVLDELHARLPDTVVYTTQFDATADTYRVVGSRGDESMGIVAGLEVPLTQAHCFLMVTERAPRYAPDAPRHFASVDPQGAVGTYAGAPIELRDGTRVGSLCVVAAASRSIDEGTLSMLAVLARALGHALETATEADRLREANERLHELATTDALTGVANRRVFEEALNRAWHLARRSWMASQVVLIDLDGLKALNDSRGHLVGDLVLVDVATALRAASRESDVVGRLGGDEFAVLLHSARSPADAEAFLSRARGALEARLRAHGVPSSFSAGFAAVAGAPSPEEALREADRAMYRRKRGRAQPDARSRTAAS